MHRKARRKRTCAQGRSAAKREGGRRTAFVVKVLKWRGKDGNKKDGWR